MDGQGLNDDDDIDDDDDDDDDDGMTDYDGCWRMTDDE